MTTANKATDVHVPSMSTDDHISVIDGSGRSTSGVFMGWIQAHRGHTAFNMRVDNQTVSVSVSPDVTRDVDYKPIDIQYNPGMSITRHEHLHPSQLGRLSRAVDYIGDGSDFQDAYRATRS